MPLPPISLLDRDRRFAEPAARTGIHALLTLEVPSLGRLLTGASGEPLEAFASDLLVEDLDRPNYTSYAYTLCGE